MAGDISQSTIETNKKKTVLKSYTYNLGLPHITPTEDLLTTSDYKTFEEKSAFSTSHIRHAK